MKNLRKIITLFITIFIVGVLITVFSVNKTLDKKVPTEKVIVSNDSLKNEKSS